MAKTGFKQAMLNPIETTKKKTRDYANALSYAYSQGFRQGYDTASRIPKRVGALHSASAGYSAGIKAYRETQKINAWLEKSGYGGQYE